MNEINNVSKYTERSYCHLPEHSNCHEKFNAYKSCNCHI